VIIHDFILIPYFLGKLEKKTVLKAGLFSLKGLLLCLFEVAESILATSFECMNIPVIIRSLHQLIIYI
jgi:hypothetical protein